MASKTNHTPLLHLVLDLDETLVSTKRPERVTPHSPNARHLAPTQRVYVRDTPYDVAKRPHLDEFLEKAAKMANLYLYTMGDEAYANAVLAYIDPGRALFHGNVFAWSTSESRTAKSLERVGCSREATLIVDDTPDVWQSEVANLCLVGRFEGEAADRGLKQLMALLQRTHAEYVGRLGREKERPTDVREVVATLRGGVFRDCTLCLTGLVSQSEAALLQLVESLGGQLTKDVDKATHVIAKRKKGWKSSDKIRMAAAKMEAGAASVFVVWDGWLLASISEWARQPEGHHAVPLGELDTPEAEEPGALLAQDIVLAAPPRSAKQLASQERAPAPSVDVLSNLLGQKKSASKRPPAAASKRPRAEADVAAATGERAAKPAVAKMARGASESGAASKGTRLPSVAVASARVAPLKIGSGQPVLAKSPAVVFLEARLS